MEKTCSRCCEKKFVLEFNKNKKKADGLQTYCKVCQAQYDKNYYKNHYTRRKKVADGGNRRRIERAVWFAEYKNKLCCELCGEKHPSCLDFHHRQNKHMNVADMVCLGASQQKIIKEIEKCYVWCANCHRKYHWQERIDNGHKSGMGRLVRH